MHTKSLLSIGALGALLAGPAAANIDIVFDYSYDTGGFFSDSLRKNLMDSAASVFESRITDTLGAITSSGAFGVNHFNPNFENPSTGSTTTLSDYSVGLNKITVFVGGNSLSGNTLGHGGPGGFGYSGTSAFANSVKRGQTGYLNASDTDFGPWGGSISFNSSFSNWYFDSTLATSNDISGYDFYSVALHELAHVLGMGTADSWNDQIVGIPCSPSVSCTLGGYALNYANSDKGHWKSGSLSTINGQGSFEVAMDPDILNNTRKNFTDQDWAGMTAIGWQVAAVAAVPEPETWAMLLAGLGLVGFAAARKEKRRQG